MARDLAGSILQALLVWGLVRTANTPWRVTLTASALELMPAEPATSASAAERWLLKDISSYSLMELNDPGKVQMKLFRADGRTLILREPRKPQGPALHDFFDELTQRLSLSNPATTFRPNFYQTFWGYLVAGTMLLLAVGGRILVYFHPNSSAGYLTLLTGVASYLAFYVRNNRQPD